MCLPIEIQAKFLGIMNGAAVASFCGAYCVMSGSFSVYLFDLKQKNV